MRTLEYRIRMQVTAQATGTRRWELYRLLGEPVRLRLLCLAAEEELAIGELAELLGEGQPNVSRHVKPLRRAGLLSVRKQGTRVFVRLAGEMRADAVVADALASGRGLCEADGSLGRVPGVVARRDAPSREFFAADGGEDGEGQLPAELPAYLSALAPLVPRRRLAVDAGTGNGRLLDVLAPVFDHVLAVDREASRLAHAAARASRRAYSNVELVEAELGDAELSRRVAALGGADAVFASRVLHHAPQPARAVEALAALAAPGGAVVVVDYAPHHDERMRDEQADLWLGFEPAELEGFARSAGLVDPVVTTIPAARCGAGPDGHLDWQVLVGRTAST